MTILRQGIDLIADLLIYPDNQKSNFRPDRAVRLHDTRD